MPDRSIHCPAWIALLAAVALATLVYLPGLYGGWLFDDYPNIVDNHAVQPSQADIPSLVGAALSSPASEFKRPLASLSFAANFLFAGLDPFWMKLTNLFIHLFNGVLVFMLAHQLIRRGMPRLDRQHAGYMAALICAGWLLLPINLTAVLYVVQRMESMANAFVLLGLIGYMRGRQQMIAQGNDTRRSWRGLVLIVFSLIGATVLGLLAKETAVMLPLYALLVEWVLFRFQRHDNLTPSAPTQARDGRIVALFVIVLLMPMLGGLAWQLPKLLNPADWATRDFSLGTRLLSEARIVMDYIPWTVLPLPHELSFYHDDYTVSRDLFSPWTTLPSMLLIVALFGLACGWRKRRSLASLGLLLFLGCQLLTGTVLPLELIYEHRNYFASFGLLLALVSLLWPAPSTVSSIAPNADARSMRTAYGLRWIVLGVLLVWWTALTASTAYAWGEPLRLAQALAARAPDSPRAQYELGRTYIIYSHNDPNSPYTQAAYAPLERAAAMPESSILPQQALIFMNARMELPLKDIWWDSMIAKLKARPTGVQDDSSLSVLAQCARDGNCDLPKDRMQQAFEAAIAHPNPSARILATYADYAWNVLHDDTLGLRMIQAAVAAAPDEPAYRLTDVRMLIALHRVEEARAAMVPLKALNIGGRLNDSLDNLRQRISAQAGASSSAKP